MPTSACPSPGPSREISITTRPGDILGIVADSSSSPRGAQGRSRDQDRPSSIGGNGGSAAASEHGSESENDFYVGETVFAAKHAGSYAQPARPRRQSLPSLFAKLGPGCDLGEDDDGLTPHQRRELVQVERAREAVRETLLAKRLLDPQLCVRPIGLPRFTTRASQPQPELPPAGSRTCSQISTSSHSGPGPPPGLLLPHTHVPGSAPNSPMAAAAARRRQLTLDVNATTHAGSQGLAGPGPPAPRRDAWRRNSVAGGPGVGHVHGGGGHGLGGAHMMCGAELFGGGGSDWEGEGEGEEGSHVGDLGALVRSERQRLSMVQSKVTGQLRTQRRTQGLLANCPGGPRATPTAEELTASVIPNAGKPPSGMDLKVPLDDIRFSGVRLRFLMGLLEALEENPLLCRTTAELVSNLVVPLTADHKCRLLDLIPREHRGQPHHYICHAWPCSARELLHTLQRQMLPHPPPPPPPAMGTVMGGIMPKPPPPKPAGLAAGNGRSGPYGKWAGGGAGRGPGVRSEDGTGGGAAAAAAAAAAHRRMPGGLAPGAYLPHLGASAGGAALAAVESEAMALHDADAGRTHLPTIGGGGSGGGVAEGAVAGVRGGGGGGGQPRGRDGGSGLGGGDSGGGEAGSQPPDVRPSEAVWRQLYDAYKEDLHRALDQVVWIDVVCNNQHAPNKKDYGKAAKTVIACGATVLVLDTQLTALTRTWCLFEVMNCLRCKRHLKVFRAHQTLAAEAVGPQAAGGDGGSGGCLAGDERRWDRAVETISLADSRASSEQDRVGILQEVLTTVGTAYVNDVIKAALRLSSSDRARQLAVRREQLRTTLDLLQPDPATIGTELYENNLAKCREHLQGVLQECYPEDMLRCIIPRDYVSDSARCWDMLCIFAEILDRELFREDARALRSLAWLIFKRHSKRYIDVLYEKELDNWLINSLERDRKWRRTQAKLKHDAQKKWN